MSFIAAIIVQILPGWRSDAWAWDTGHYLVKTRPQKKRRGQFSPPPLSSVASSFTYRPVAVLRMPLTLWSTSQDSLRDSLSSEEEACLDPLARTCPLLGDSPRKFLDDKRRAAKRTIRNFW